MQRARIFLTGVGGQGTLTATTLLARTALAAGIPVTSGEIHGMAFQILCDGRVSESFRDCLYLSVSLFTNTGCADCVPTPNLRLLAASEAFFGYLTLGVLCACLIVILVRLIAADKLRQ